MGEEHEQPVQAFIEVGIAFGLEELEAEVGEDGGFEELHEFVDLDEHGEGHFEVGEDLKEGVGLFVGLGEEAETEGRDGVVGPGAEEGGEESLAILGKGCGLVCGSIEPNWRRTYSVVEIAEALSQVCEFRGGDKVVI